ncbi:MAG: DUF58 domain-containing protein [Proteobacteria bacterium]|nr:DUF58 domain-containing protein [Pseudomonadota bacterium]
MDGHLNKEFTLADLVPGWSEDLSEPRRKTSMRLQGSLNMSLLRVGRNPENSRKYVAGDPVSLIDWKAYARTDVLIVREQRDEASAHIVLVIDCGKSMKWPGAEDRKSLTEEFEQIVSKFELAIRIGLWLTHSHLVSGDSVECWLRSDGLEPSMRWRPRSPSDVIAVFSACELSLSERLPDFFIEVPWNHPRSDLLWLLTDGLDPWKFEDVAQSSRKSQLLHILSSLETDVAWMDDETCYLVQEPTRKDYMGLQLKSGTDYQDRVAKWRSDLEKRIRNLSGDYFLATDKTAVGLFIHFLSTGGAR